MPTATRKRKSNAGTEEKDKTKLTKKKAKSDNSEFFEEMKKEADANRINAIERKRKEVTKTDRRTTITASPSSMRNKSSNQKSSRPSTGRISSTGDQSPDERTKFFNSMKKEADANRLKSAEKKEKEKSVAKSRPNRRVTIAAASSSSSSRQKATSGKNSRSPRKQTPAPGARRGSMITSSDTPELPSDEESSNEDQFDRLVQPSPYRRGSQGSYPSESTETNAYAKMYSWKSSQPPSKRQMDLQRRKELEMKNKRSDDVDSESDTGSSSDSDADDIVRKIEGSAAESEDEQLKEYSKQEAHTLMSLESGDNVQLDNILYSSVSFLLGFMLVAGIYVIVKSLDLDAVFVAMTGSKYLEASDVVRGLANRVVLLVIVLSMAFLAIEVFLLINLYANGGSSNCV